MVVNAEGRLGDFFKHLMKKDKLSKIKTPNISPVRSSKKVSPTKKVTTKKKVSPTKKVTTKKKISPTKKKVSATKKVTIKELIDKGNTTNKKNKKLSPRRKTISHKVKK